MAFTTGEFLRGALSAWLWFLGLSTAGFGIFFLTALPIVVVYTVPISFAAAILGAAPALGLGWILRRQPSVELHAAAFTVYGFVFGVAATAVTLAVMGGVYAAGAVFWIIPVACSTIAMPLGWARGSRAARRSVPRIVHLDPDAEAEGRLAS
ncbi:hypothetical protein [Microbacterium sp. CJ88]|uniref:hypothetical protein n=1 Tax=Microbacterium sp. CJ88 TaxID=3445672 RepID=UPI003F658BAA